VTYNPKLTGERMNVENEASPASETSDVERPVMRNGERRECVILMHDGATALAKWNEYTSRWMFAQPYFGLEIGHGAVKAWRYVDELFNDV